MTTSDPPPSPHPSNRHSVTPASQTAAECSSPVNSAEMFTADILKGKGKGKEKETYVNTPMDKVDVNNIVAAYAEEVEILRARAYLATRKYNRMLAHAQASDMFFLEAQSRLVEASRDCRDVMHSFRLKQPEDNSRVDAPQNGSAAAARDVDG